MNYDDFSLSQNFENMAAEYHKTLQDKGFVFVRLDNTSAKNFALKAAQEMAYMLAILTVASRNPLGRNALLMSLKNLSEIQLQSLIKLYCLNPPKTPVAKSANFEIIVSCVASVLKALFDLYEHEDNTEKRILIKNMIDQQLDTLSANTATKY